MCKECQQINKSEVYGKIREVQENGQGMIKFSMLIHAHEARGLKADRANKDAEEKTGFNAPPCAVGLWSREILLLMGEIGAGVNINLFQAIEIIRKKLVTDALNGLFNHAKKRK